MVANLPSLNFSFKMSVEMVYPFTLQKKNRNYQLMHREYVEMRNVDKEKKGPGGGEKLRSFISIVNDGERMIGGEMHTHDKWWQNFDGNSIAWQTMMRAAVAMSVATDGRQMSLWGKMKQCDIIQIYTHHADHLQ